eukprot:818824-Amphidinium_carterae.1
MVRVGWVFSWKTISTETTESRAFSGLLEFPSSKVTVSSPGGPSTAKSPIRSCTSPPMQEEDKGRLPTSVRIL